MSRRPYIGTSDAQANADALMRRGAPYSGASGASFRVHWDFHRREPQDLREAVRMVRRAYADEVPDKLHDAAIGQDGTPRMTAKAESYIFGRADSDDASKGKCICMNVAAERRAPPDTVASENYGHYPDCPANPKNRDLVGYHLTPFRAALERMTHGNEATRKRAAIVSHVTIGSQGPQEAAITEGVPAWCAKTVAEDAIRTFLRGMSDIKLHVPRELSEGAAVA